MNFEGILEDKKLDHVTGGGFATDPSNVDGNRTLAVLAAVSFATGNIVYGAAALTALVLRN